MASGSYPRVGRPGRAPVVRPQSLIYSTLHNNDFLTMGHAVRTAGI
jgi:hypothetical protein